MIDPVSRTAAIAPEGVSLAPSRAAGQTDFGALLGQMITQTGETLRAGEATSIAGIRGQASVQQVVEAVMSAERTLQTAIAIRDKAVAAYLEVSRMAI